ncbi:ribonuclease domain-containing protein, partial [Lachnotalea glycerini]
TLKQVVEFFSGFVDSIATNMNLPGEHNHASYEEALKEAYYNGAVAGDVVSIITGVILTVAGTAETVAGGIGDIFGAVISMSGAGAAAGIPTIAISTDVLITGIAEMAYGISISMTATDNLAGDIKKAQEAAENTDVSKGGSETVPDKAYDVAEQVERNNGAAPKGYKGGDKYKNIPKNPGDQKLPSGVKYKEYDVNPRVKGQNRGTERIVIGDDGSVWYTKDHYHSFTKIK